MFKYAKFTLLTLAAFLLLGFSITANATPPWLEDRDQMITSAPLKALGVGCLAANLTDDVIYVDFALYYTGYFPIEIYNEEIGPKDSLGYYGSSFSVPTSGFCTVSWVGQPGDVKASLCSYESTLPLEVGIGCFELN